MTTMQAVVGIGWAVTALASVGALYAIAAGVLVWRFLGRSAARAPEVPISILKPLHGDEAGLAAALASFLAQDYRAGVQLICGVQDPADSAIAVVNGLAGADLVVDATPHGENRKVANLINMLPKAAHDVLILSDSDIRVGRGYLAEVTGALAAPGVGAVTCLYRGEGTGLWSRLAAMAISYNFLPNAVTGMGLGLARPCFGSTIALRRDTLARIGGLAAFADVLADDYAIGRAVRRAGMTVAMPPMTVIHQCAESSPRELWDHEVRWAVTIRGIEGAGYAGSLVTHALPLALLGAALTGLDPAALAVLAGVLAARLGLKFTIDAATGASAGPAWLLPVRDTISLAVFVWSFCVNSVGWRGRRFRVGSGGHLIGS